MDEFGWDKDDRTYYVLDDNRLYRRTDPPLPTDSSWKPKANTLKAQAARRRDRKRRRTRQSSTPDVEDDEESRLDGETEGDKKADNEDTLGGYKWECVCVTLAQYKEFVEARRKTRDENERNLVHAVEDTVMPLLEKAEEAQLRKIQKREKELLAMEKMATAKRSSRLADKHERERIEHEQAEAERKRAVELAAARKMEEQQRKMEEERQSRMLTREQRIKEREYKRILHEEELARMEEEAKKIEAGEIRDSRHLKANIEKHRKDLEELENEDEWMFDCSGCGAHGKNFVSFSDTTTSAALTMSRTMARIAWHVRSATFGNTANATAYLRMKLKMITSISSAKIVVVARKRQRSPRFLPSNFALELLLHLLQRMPLSKLRSDLGEDQKRHPHRRPQRTRQRLHLLSHRRC